MIILRLFWEFLKIGMFSVGGGMVTLPFLYDLADKTGWYTHGQIADMLAVSESTPGPMGINMATYVGYTVGGPIGSLAATIGVITPGIILILIITTMIKRFRESRYVEGAFYGIRPASVGLIAAAGILVAKLTFLDLDIYGETGKILDLINFKYIILAAALLYFTRSFKKTKGLHPVVFIAASAVIGIILGG